MTLASFLSKADFLAAAVVVATMFLVSVLAYRRAKMSAFLCLICGSLIFIILAAVLRLYKPASKEDAAVLLGWCHVGHLAATILCGIGIWQLVEYVRREFERKSPPGAVEPTAAPPSVSDMPSNLKTGGESR
jgi:hypothetical protein